MTIRSYTPADFSTVEQWAKARNMALIPQLLSPNGFIVEDEEGPLLVAWVYLTFDCPLAFVDHLLTRPSSSLKSSLKAWRIFWQTTLSFLSKLRDCNGNALAYKIVRIFTRPAFSRFLRADGWQISDHQSQQAVYVVS